MTEQNGTLEPLPEILIVEDSLVEAELLRRTLAKAGYRVIVARNGQEGLQTARSRRPGLVMSDINMPVMDGYQLCRALKYDEQLWNIPLILLTVLSEPEDIIEAINSGADAYIIKPFAEAVLLERIKALLNARLTRPRSDERREEVVGYGGERHRITGGGQQILNLLLSLYENTFTQNRELMSVQAQLNQQNMRLDQQVRERTAALSTVNRALRTLSAGNKALVRATGEDELLQSAVRNIVDNGGYGMAEIIYLCGDAEKILMPMARAGAGKGLDSSKMPVTEIEAGENMLPIAVAVQSGMLQVCRNIAADPRFRLWQEDEPDRGYAANICLPLIDGGRIFGVVNIFSRSHDSFDDEEARLLEELANDIAYGIANLRARADLQVAEQSLFESGKMLNTITSAARDAIALIDGDGIVRFWNPAAEKLFGYSADEIMQRSLHDLIVPERYLCACQAGIAHFKETGEGPAVGRTIELTALNRDGLEFPVEISLSSIQIDGRWHAAGIVRDISERKQSEQAKHAFELRYRRLFETAKDGILILDAETGIIIDVNPFLVELVGCAFEELIGKPIWELSGFSHLVATEEDFQALQQQGYRRDEDLLLQTSTGKIIYAEFTCNVYLVENAKVIHCNIRDISDRKIAEAAVEQERNRLAAILQTASDGIHMLDSNGVLSEANDTFLDMLGYDRTMLGRLRVTDFDVQLDCETIKAKFRKLITERGTMLLETKHRRSDGRVIDVEVNARALVLDGQDYILASSRNITERKRFEAIQRIQSKRTQALLELPLIAERMNESEFMQYGQELAEQATDSKISFVHLVSDNQDNIELVAWSSNTLEKYCKMAAYDKHYPVTQAGIWADALRQKAPVVYNDYGSCPDKRGLPEGHSELTRLISVPVIEDGKVVMLAGVGNKPEHYSDMDVETVQLFAQAIWRIVQRHRNEEKLRKLSLAVEQSPESIVITNLNAEIEYVNEAFLQITGYSREEIIGQNPRLLKSGKTPQANYEAMWQALAQGCPWKGEMVNRRKDGSEYTEFASISPIRQANGQISHYLAVKENITERKLISEELDEHRHHLEQLVETRTHELALAKQAAETANESKSAFVANMSHEIRTPLNAIIGLTHLLRRSRVDLEQKEKLNKIIDASEHLLSIINDILDFSKIEAGKLHLSAGDFSCGGLLANVISMIGPKLRDKRLEIVVEQEQLPPVLVGDPTRLAQALLNYLANAVKFTDQGRIVLRLSKIEETVDDLLVRFEVTDTGIGIPAENIANLFAAFEQVDTTTTRRYGGTGLGLAISQRLAHLMGGEVGVESVLGRGSTFWFSARLGKSRLGLAELAEASSVAESSLQAMPVGTRVLLAEDNPINQEVAVALLTEVGLTVEIANDGIEAVQKASSGVYDLILMDMQMPNMDGLDATRAIRALPGCATLPIVAMTANAFDEDRERCLAAGMNGFVAKPVDPELLFSTLLSWLPASTLVMPDSPVVTQAPPVELSKISGLDVKRGLKILNGDLPAYQRLLRRFAICHANDMARLRDLLIQGNADAALRLVHTLKGSSGNLGLTGLPYSAAELEAALDAAHDASEIERLIGNLEKEVQDLAAAIISVLPEPPLSCPDNVDWIALRQVLDDLEPMLEGAKMQANRLVDTHSALLRAALGTLGEELAQQIACFLYPEALETLRQARSKHPELAKLN